MANKFEMRMERVLPRMTPSFGVYAYITKFDDGGWAQIFFPKRLTDGKKIKEINVTIEWEE